MCESIKGEVKLWWVNKAILVRINLLESISLHWLLHQSCPHLYLLGCQTLSIYICHSILCVSHISCSPYLVSTPAIDMSHHQNLSRAADKFPRFWCFCLSSSRQSSHLAFYQLPLNACFVHLTVDMTDTCFSRGLSLFPSDSILSPPWHKWHQAQSSFVHFSSWCSPLMSDGIPCFPLDFNIVFHLLLA